MPPVGVSAALSAAAHTKNAAAVRILPCSSLPVHIVRIMSWFPICESQFDDPICPRGMCPPEVGWGLSYTLNMSIIPQEDWRAQALRNMELADQPVAEPRRQDGWLGTVLLKIVLLVAISVALVWFAGWGFLAAPAFAAWYFFWPR